MTRDTRPLIGVTGPDRGGLPAWLMTALAIHRAGGRPLRIRPCRSVEPHRLAGLVIGGGSDVDPLHYGEEPLDREEEATRTRLLDWIIGLSLALLRILFARSARENYDPARDAMEKELIEHALQAGKPLLGICRGAQLLNVCLGGSLHQSIDHFYVEGTSNLRSVLPRKQVHIEATSKLAGILATERCQVNALHRQCVREPGRGVIVTARESNGVTQAIELDGEGFALGVQWHPEYLPQVARQQSLFRALVSTAAASA